MNLNKGQFGYTVELRQHVEHSVFSEEQYGHWEESCSNSFSRIYRRTDKGYPDITSDLDLNAGDECFVVWVEWSSGDSFGYGYRNHAEAVALFDNYEEANKFSLWVTKVSSLSIEEWTQKYITAKGEEITVYAGTWSGYFETLEDVNIEHTTISYSL